LNNNKQTNNMNKEKNTNKEPKPIKRGPGRPKAEINIPKGKFTFSDLEEANSHVTPLTLRKFLKRDASKRNMSEVILIKDETREPNSKDGLGRKVYVYTRRAGAVKPTGLKAARKSTVSVPLASKSTEDYEAAKAALTAPAEPAPTAPAPTADEVIA
jgi:hypothetical protein